MPDQHPDDSADPEYLIGETRIQTWSPFHYLCVGDGAAFAELDILLDSLMAKLEGALDCGRVRPVGPVVLRFAPAPAVGEDTYRLEAGYPVRPSTTPAPGTQVLSLPAFRCATVLYCGAVDAEHIQEAYNRLSAALKEAGLEATGEGREWYLYFDGDHSPNNVTLIQQGIRSHQGVG